MAKNLFTPPGTQGFRNITEANQNNGNIVNAVRYPDIGGYTSSKKGMTMSPFKQKYPARKS